MSVKRCSMPLLMALFAAPFLAVPLSAATVSFLVIETGLDMEADRNQHSGLWESGLLDVFFESGHIVSNAPVMRIDRMPAENFPEEAQGELAEALEGGIEYIVVALLEYQVKGAGASTGPRNVTLRLFRTRPFEMLCEQKHGGGAPRNIKEEFENLKKTVRNLIPQVK